MRLAVVVVGALALIAACGDNGGRGVDAGSASDAFVSPDATVCAPGAIEVELVNVFGGPGTQIVTLDGMGTRCEQLTRGIMDPAVLPPELEPIRALELRADCFESGSQDFVQFTGTGVGGVPLLGQQWFVNFVLEDLRLDFWNGSYLSPDDVPGPACLGTTELQLQMPGAELPYLVDDPACIGATIATYIAQAGDTFEIGDQALYLDPLVFPLRLHRVRLVQVYLLPSHVTPPMHRSGLFCCTDSSLIDCVGMLLIVDAFTGEMVQPVSQCDPVCTPEM